MESLLGSHLGSNVEASNSLHIFWLLAFVFFHLLHEKLSLMITEQDAEMLIEQDILRSPISWSDIQNQIFRSYSNNICATLVPDYLSD